jgi:hypothetical protein
MSHENQHEAGSEQPVKTVGEIQALRCADCARSDSLVTGVEPSSRIAIPAEALAGFPDGVPRPPAGRHSRRTFLAGSAIGMASIYSAAHLSWESVWDAAAARAATPSNDTILVCIYLNGGNDGLNAIVPVSSSQYPGYVSQRSNIARVLGPSGGGKVGTTVMGGTGGSLAFANPLVSGAGNNGASVGLDTLYGDGSGGTGSDLAIFPAADYQPANLSHFESRDYWFAGALEEMSTGWLGRWLDRYGSKQNPLQAISIDTALSQSILTASAPVCAISNLTDTSFQLAGQNANPDIERLAAIRASRDNISLRRARAIYGETVQVSKQAATGGDAAVRGVGDARRDDRLGVIRHARGPDHLTGSAAVAALPGAGGIQGRPDRARDRAAGADARLLRVRTADRLQRLARDRPWRRRPRDGQWFERARRAGRRASRCTGRRKRQPGPDHRLPYRVPVADQ